MQKIVLFVACLIASGYALSIDVCNPSPCGKEALCEHSKREGKVIALCSCPVGYKGDPFVSCEKGDCEKSSDCPKEDEACHNYSCQNLCTTVEDLCGKNTVCTMRSHSPICSCKENYTGNPFIACTSIYID